MADIQTATSFGGPFVLIPRELMPCWVEKIGDNADPDHGLYGEVCGSSGVLGRIPFEGIDVVKIGESPEDLFWVARDGGGLLVQWIAADSVDDLISFAVEVAGRREWLETLEFDIGDTKLRAMDSCGYDQDDQPKIDFDLPPGRYRLSACYGENETTMALVFELSRQ